MKFLFKKHTVLVAFMSVLPLITKSHTSFTDYRMQCYKETWCIIKDMPLSNRSEQRRAMNDIVYLKMDIDMHKKDCENLLKNIVVNMVKNNCDNNSGSLLCACLRVDQLSVEQSLKDVEEIKISLRSIKKNILDNLKPEEEAQTEAGNTETSAEPHNGENSPE